MFSRILSVLATLGLVASTTTMKVGHKRFALAPAKSSNVSPLALHATTDGQPMPPTPSPRPLDCTTDNQPTPPHCP